MSGGLSRGLHHLTTSTPHHRSALQQSSTGAPAGRSRPRKNCIKTSIEIGRYLVSPLSHSRSDGRHEAAVSIRSGHGSATHDRVMRFSPLFNTARAALRYATDQGLAWVAGRSVAVPSPSNP